MTVSATTLKVPSSVLISNIDSDRFISSEAMVALAISYCSVVT